MVEYLPEVPDDVFLALADRTRREIVAYLRRGRSRITEIAGRFPISLNAVSKHLKILERAGLIRRDILGREHWCTLNAAPLKDVNDWVGRYERFWNQRVDVLETSIARRRSARRAAIKKGQA